MRSTPMIWMGLAAVMVLGTGASPSGVQQAREWQQEGDVAMAGHQWDIACSAYEKIATTFPNTRHGRRAEARLQVVREKMLSPARSPTSENPFSWIGELIDFLVWP